MTPQLIGVMGPTASGKTNLAEQIAEHLDAQLVNADAFQIYCGMDIGTAKPNRPENYELIDIRNPDESFGVGEYVVVAQSVLRRCWERRQSVVVVGGSGLYVRALFEEYSEMGQAPPPEVREALNARPLEELAEELRKLAPETANVVDLRNRVRVQRALERIYSPKPSVSVHLPPFDKKKLAIVRNSDETNDRIQRRTKQMFESGWIEEVRKLFSDGYAITNPGFRALGYEAIGRAINGEATFEEALATTIADTKRYAKRQRTWLRSEPNLVILDSEDALRHAAQELNLIF